MQIPNTQWDWLVQPRRKYGVEPRGDFFEKFGGKWVPHYEKGKYDLALLHLDQQCITEQLWDRGKGSLYKELNEEIKDIPKIVLMHGTPYYPEHMKAKDIIEKVRDVVGDNVMVTNSFKAAEQWAGKVDFELKDEVGKKLETNYKGVPKDQIFPIWHGLDPKEWWDLPKEPRVVTMIGPAGLDAYYDRSLLAAVKEILRERDIQHCHITADVNFKNFDEYREFLGTSLLYFHPAKEAPMSRSRTEAMLSGCCVLTTNNQDADMVIKDGENGFLVPRNPEHIADIIEMFITGKGGYKKAVDIGKKGKQTAIELFDKDRYQSEWVNLINKVIKK